MIFIFTNYRHYLESLKKAKPKNGRGFYARLAGEMNMTSAQMSHVVKGQREFTLEQAIKCADALGMTATETEYFLQMVSLARAGSQDLQNYSKRKLLRLKKLGLQLKNQVPIGAELTDSQRAEFYSSWHYSAIRLLSSVRPIQITEVADRLHIQKSRVGDIFIFLQEAGLCVPTDQGLIIGQQSTFVPKTSPFVHKHHSNWRLKALDQSELNLDSNLFFTSPVSLSISDYEKLKVELTEFIKQFSLTVKASQAERVACLNIDLFLLPS